MSIQITYADRVKELSYTTGTGNFALNGVPNTSYFTFSGSIPYNATVMYCIRDNENSEVGSGQFILDGSTNTLTRYPFKSTNSNNRVNFGAGVKEVFVTYPGKYAVGSALPNDAEPQESGVAIWTNKHTLIYDSNFIWDTGRGRLGVRQSDPLYTLDLGGTETQSHVRASGFIAGDSGIMFSGVSATGGRQTEPFLRNVADNVTGFDAVISLSGEVDERLQLEQQAPRTFFCGPSGECGCTEDYPTFRIIQSGDLPDLSELYMKQYNNASPGKVAVYYTSGVVQYDDYLHWNPTLNRLGVNKTLPAYTLDVDGNAGISGAMVGSGNWMTSGNLEVDGSATINGAVTIGGNLDVQGNVTYIDSNTVTVLDKQLELGSLSGTAAYDESLLNDAGLTVLSSSASGDKQWVWKSSNNRWNTSAGVGIGVSGQIAGGSGLSVQSINVGGGTTLLNYINGNIFFRGNTSQPIKMRIIDNGINPYTSGSAYCGFLTRPWNQTASWVSNLERGEKTGQFFLYSAAVTSGVDPDGYDNYQRLAVSGNRFGNFEITTQALGSGVNRAIEFTTDTIFTSGTTMSSTMDVAGTSTFTGNVGISGTTTLNGTVVTTSGDAATNTIIDASGMLVIPTFSSLAEASGALPRGQAGAMALGGNYIMVSNGTTWLSGLLLS